jgi:MFS family permease
VADAPGRFSSLRHADFRLFLAGHFVSRAGSQFQIFALSWHLWLLTRSPLALGLIGACRVVPVILLAIGAGVAADAFDRRRLMLTTQVVLGLTSAAMAWLTWSGRASSAALLALVAVAGAATAFDNPARQTLVVSLVPREDLPNGLSLNVMTWQLATVIGPALAGLLLAHTSLTFLYAVDAVSFFVMVGALLRVRPRATQSEGVRPSVRAAVEGMRYLRGQPVLMSMMALDFLATFFAGALLLLPVYADQILRVGEKGLGLMMAAPSVGSLLASVWLAWRPAIRRQGAVMLGAIVVYGGAVAAFGSCPWFPLSLALLAVSGAADTVSTVVRVIARNLMTPDELRGRMSSLTMIFFMGGPQLGELEAGVVAQLTSVPFSVSGGGVACILCAVATALLVPALRRHRLEGAGAPAAAAAVPAVDAPA